MVICWVPPDSLTNFNVRKNLLTVTYIKNWFQNENKDTDLSAEYELEYPEDEHTRHPHDEGEDGGQEEAPPFSFPQTFFWINFLKTKYFLTLSFVAI